MDIPTPSPFVASTAAGEQIARGTAGSWSLDRVVGHVVLSIAGIPSLRLKGGAWRMTVRGREFRAIDERGAPVILRVVHGLCEGGGSPAVLHAGGRVMPGCLVGAAGGPYPED